MNVLLKKQPVFCIILALFFLVVVPHVSHAATFTVTKTADTNDGLCNEDCSLREALEQAQQNNEQDTIQFSIPTSDPGYVRADGSRSSTREDPRTYPETPNGFFILPLQRDLVITERNGVTIDGYSQQSARRNTQRFGRELDTRLVLQIEMDRSIIRITDSQNVRLSGFSIQGGDIVVEQGSSNTQIDGNYIGTDITGSETVSEGAIKAYRGAQRTFIGTDGDGIGDIGERNIISPEEDIAVQIGDRMDIAFDSNNITLENSLAGNYIGTDRTGRVCIADIHRFAVYLDGGQTNRFTQVGSNLDGFSGEEERNIIGCVKNSFRFRDGALVRFHADSAIIAKNYIGVSALGDDLTTVAERPIKGVYGFQTFADGPGTFLTNRDNSVIENTVGNIPLFGIHISGENNLIRRNVVYNGESHGIVISDRVQELEFLDEFPTTENTVLNNRLYNNAGAGVAIQGTKSLHTWITNNYIYNNTGLGIDIDPSGTDYLRLTTGVNENDPGDRDETSFGNLLVNRPVIQRVGLTGDGYFMAVVDLDLNPGERPFTVELFDNDFIDESGYGEGRYFIGAADTGAVGDGVFISGPIIQRTPTSAGTITATVSNNRKATSEFSGPPVDTTIAQLDAVILINNGAERTDSRDVTLTIGVLTPFFTPTEMIVGNDAEFIGRSWENYTNTKAWQLTEGNGAKRVHVRFRNAAGVETPLFYDGIGLNADSPVLFPTALPSPPFGSGDGEGGLGSGPGGRGDGTGSGGSNGGTGGDSRSGGTGGSEGSGSIGAGVGGGRGGGWTPIQVIESELGFRIPGLSVVLTFFVRLFFILVGIAALFFGLYGAFSWVISSGEQENVDKARNRIVAALVGVLLTVVILAVIYSMEQFVFQQRVCFGLSCPVTVPGILEACVPNPQYRLPDNFVQDRIEAGMTEEELYASDECCPFADVTLQMDIRLTTGWKSGASNFGNYDYKICCIYGDENGNQICDGEPTEDGRLNIR